MALSLAASPLLVEWLGFRGAMSFLAAVATGWALLFHFTSRENHPARQAATAAKPAAIPVRALLMNRNLAVIFATAFIGQGCFNALTTWLESIWHERGFSSDAAGMAGGMIIAGGIAGALVIPPLLDKFDHPRLLLWICLAPSLLLVHPFVFAARPRLGYAWGIVGLSLAAVSGHHADYHRANRTQGACRRGFRDLLDDRQRGRPGADGLL
jgi:cyanate permease